MNNLHISLTDFKNESRVLKEVRSLSKSNIFKEIYIAALHDEGLDEESAINDNIYLKRFILSSRSFSKSLLFQAIKYFEFLILLYKYYFDKNIKVINVHSLGLLPVGIIFKILFSSKLIYDAHELETERNGLVGIRKKISKVVERLLINWVDEIVVVSESIADWYAENYNTARPVVVLNSPNYKNVNKKNIFRDELNISSDQKIYLYQGMLSKGRGIELIIDTFSLLTHENCVVIFMGYGPLEDDVITASKQFSNVYFYPAVSPDAVLNYTSSADFGFSIIENTCLSYYYCLPNKMFEYTMVGIPTIASNMLEMSRFIEKYKTGFIVDTLTNEGILDAILLSNSESAALAEKFDIASKEICWEVQELKMLAAYKNLLKDTLT